jgi:type IV secretion system protein VirB10
MANPRNFPVSTMIAFLTLAGTNVKQIVVTFTTIVLTCACLAQDQPPASTPPDAQTEMQSSGPNQTAETIPAGTRLSLVLTHPIFSNTTHRGDDIHAQTTAPVVVGDRVVIPGGVFVQGKVEKLTRRGSRGEMQMQSVAVIFPDGSVVNIAGPVHVESDEGTAWLNPSGPAKAGMAIAPIAGLGLGALIGSAAHTTQSSTLGGTTITSSTPKGIAIGSVVGLAAGGVVSLVLLTRGHQFFVDVGSPMQMTLPQPLTLAESQIADALRAAQQNPPPVPVPTPRAQPPAFPSTPASHGTCYTPDTPGGPPTVIPGIPGPNGVPGPPTIIPGAPPIPGTPYPCP